MDFRAKLERFWYQNILRPIFSLSKLGKSTMQGKADSGLNIEHIYLNKPEGVTKIGKLIDRILLNLPSVKATRHKKDIIIKILSNEIENNTLLNRKIKILDIASGPSHYLVDIVTSYNQDNIEVLCLDSDRGSINIGKRLAVKKPIRYTKVNVFKLRHLKNFSKKILWKPNIIISTGFFELIPDELVKTILRDIFDHMEYNGLALFTSQADNPSKKLMAQIGKRMDGQKWSLYFRSPEYLRKVMLDIGFRDVIISVDQWGIYEYCTGRNIKDF